MNPRTERLRELMESRGLNDAQVADILGLSETTVRIYRCKTDCSKTIPARALDLLELRTGSPLRDGSIPREKHTPKPASDVANDRVEFPIPGWAWANS